MPKQIEVSWFHTEAFTATVTVDDDFDINADDVDEVLDGSICDLDQPELSAAFTGCLERQITHKQEVGNPTPTDTEKD